MSAIRRTLSKYGAYTNHLITLSEDIYSIVRSADRVKLCGYCLQWTDAKYVLGCAVFIDVLTPSSMFSMTMQSDALDIVAAVTSLLKAV